MLLFKGYTLVQDGAFLLGLSAWHLYSDMRILRDALNEVKMPPVAKGGTIT